MKFKYKLVKNVKWHRFLALTNNNEDGKWVPLTYVSLLSVFPGLGMNSVSNSLYETLSIPMESAYHLDLALAANWTALHTMSTIILTNISMMFKFILQKYLEHGEGSGEEATKNTDNVEANDAKKRWPTPAEIRKKIAMRHRARREITIAAAEANA